MKDWSVSWQVWWRSEDSDQMQRPSWAFNDDKKTKQKIKTTARGETRQRLKHTAAKHTLDDESVTHKENK